MKLDRWQHWLSQGGKQSYSHRHPELAARIFEGIEFGVPVDYVGGREKERFGPNLPILADHIPKVTAVIEKDVAAGKKAGPFSQKPFPRMCVSPIGAVPKRGSNNIRVIHHLSFPHHGDSVNAGIVDEYLPLSSFGHAARAVRALGRGCFLIKLDVEAAYKQVPVRREDWPLLGFKWRNKWYYERVLPFGLRSSCRLWELYAAALHFLCQHVLGKNGRRIVIHYVDDFLFVVQGAEGAQELLLEALALCADLGLPMAMDKTVGPTTQLIFLGIELDTLLLRARLPDTRLHDLQRLMADWGRKKRASVVELQSLTGLLNFACAVVRPGRFYLRRIINHTMRVAAIARSRTALFPISAAVMADIAWWQHFLSDWNGVSLLYELDWIQSIRIELFTDSCETGYGAAFGSEWFAGTWSPEELAAAQRRVRASMPFLELRALVLAAATWGDSWTGKKIIFRCDCLPVVQAISRCSSRVPQLMHQLRHLSTLACRFGFDFRCEHIVGETNIAADALSRCGDCVQFRAACPKAQLLPTPVAMVPLPSLQRQE
jgi:hypothetical protein